MAEFIARQAEAQPSLVITFVIPERTDDLENVLTDHIRHLQHESIKPYSPAYPRPVGASTECAAAGWTRSSRSPRIAPSRLARQARISAAFTSTPNSTSSWSIAKPLSGSAAAYGRTNSEWRSPSSVDGIRLASSHLMGGDRESECLAQRQSDVRRRHNPGGSLVRPRSDDLPSFPTSWVNSQRDLKAPTTRLRIPRRPERRSTARALTSLPSPGHGRGRSPRQRQQACGPAESRASCGK